MIQECCSAIPAKKFFLSACLECVLGPLPVRLVWRNCRCNKDEPLEQCWGPKLPEHNLTFECPINDQQLQHKLKLEVLSYEQKQRSWCVLKLPSFAQMRHWGCRIAWYCPCQLLLQHNGMNLHLAYSFQWFLDLPVGWMLFLLISVSVLSSMGIIHFVNNCSTPVLTMCLSSMMPP